jgi:AraC-like DNA-binding protein
MLGMLGAHREVMKDIRKLPLVRRSTRVEIYRRLDRGREYMHANFTHAISLAEIAGAASISPHHFLRLFKTLYGITPHQYLTGLRIDKACELLSHTSRSVTAICYDLGFESPTSFSLLFSRHVGVSPREYRALHGRKGAGSGPESSDEMRIDHE